MENNMQKTNVLFMLPNFDTGGSEKLVVDIVSRLDRSKFSPVVCVFFSGFYENKIRELNIPFYVIHKDKIRSKLATALFINDIIKKHKVDVVNTHHASPLIQGIIPFKLLNRVKWIHTEHTRLDLDPNITPWILMIEKICLRFVDICLGISDGVCDYFANELKVNKDKIKKIYNGVDVSRFIWDASESNMLKEKYRKDINIDAQKVVIGTFANFREQKNHKCLIEAIHKITETGCNNFHLVLPGSGPEKEKIEQQVCDLKLASKVSFLGPRSDIPELMNMIDIYCLPSFFEGLPFSLIEAAVAGKQVIATDVIGNRDVVKAMGRGQLVPSDDSKMLADVLVAAIHTHGEEKPNTDWRPDKQYTMDGMMESYAALFKGEFTNGL